MKKNTYLIILTIVTILCVIGGSIYHLTQFGMRLFGHHNDDAYNSGKTTAYSDSVDGFTSIVADMSVTDLNISIGGESYNISYKGSEELAATYKIEDGVLYISQPSKQVSVFDVSNSLKTETTITLPEGASLDNLMITCDVGDVDLYNLSARTASLSADVGDLDVNGCTFGEFTIDADTGDIDVENCSGTNLHIKGDVGDIDVRNANFACMEIFANVGEVDVDVVGKVSDYSLDLNASVGEVHVDGTKQSKTYKSSGSTNMTITITSDIGDISVN